MGICPILKAGRLNATFLQRNETAMAQQTQASLPGLLKEFAFQAKTFIRQEARLAKTEIAEKLSEWAGDAAWLGIGGIAAYAGFIVLLVAFGVVVAFGFERLEIDSSLAMSAGFGAIGLLTAIIGAVMLLKASKAFSQESLVPKRTIATVQKLRGEPVPTVQQSTTKDKEPKPRSEDLEKTLIATEDRLGRALEEFERRVTFSRARRRIAEQVCLHPYRCGLLALAGGLVVGFIFIRKLRI